MEKLGFLHNSPLQEQLNIENILKEQLKDEEITKIKNFITAETRYVSHYYIEAGILKQKSNSNDQPDTIVLPRNLQTGALASSHLLGHSGPRKMLNLMKLQYFWDKMKADVEEFAKGCCLCSIYKHDNKGKNVIGVPRKILEPKYCWQIDMCQGLNNVRGATSFFNHDRCLFRICLNGATNK